MRNRTYPLIYGTETYFFTDKVKLTHGYIRSEIIYPIGEPNRYTQNIAIQPSRVEMELLFAGDGFETKYRNFYKNIALNSKPEQLTLPFLNIIIPNCIIASTIQTTASAKEYGLIRCNVVFIEVSDFTNEFTTPISYFLTNTIGKINKFVDKLFNLYKYINLTIKTIRLTLAYANQVLKTLKQPISQTLNVIDAIETKKTIKKISNSNNQESINNLIIETNNNIYQPTGDVKQDEFIESYQKTIQLTILYTFSKQVLRKLYNKTELYNDLIILDYLYSSIKQNTCFEEITVIADEIYIYTYNYIMSSFLSIPLKEINLENVDYYLLANSLDGNTNRLDDLLKLNKTNSLFLNKNRVVRYV